MSHIRSLLHKSAERAHASPPASATAIPENILSFADAAAPAPFRTEFPVEEAQLSPSNRLVYYVDPRSPAADRYRLLRMRLKAHASNGKLKKILVTSPLPHDGKSTLVLNLATALAERGKRKVLVVEADLHHACLAENLSLRPWIGLSGCLAEEGTPPLSAIRRIEPLGWYLLPAGGPRRNPTELLQTPAFGHVMQVLSPHFDWILIDSPPVVPLTDSLSLQQHADATLLVVRAGSTPRDTVDHTIELLGKKNILGIVLNGVELRDHMYYQYYNADRRDHDD
jgi:capsular exopolysaccharide synthesis family protein